MARKKRRFRVQTLPGKSWTGDKNILSLLHKEKLSYNYNYSFLVSKLYFNYRIIYYIIVLLYIL